MAKAHSEFIISCFVISYRWEKMAENERKRFYDEAVNRFGVDVIRQTVDEIANAGKLFNVIDYCFSQLPPV